VPGLGCATLDELRELIGDCHRCPLGDTRTTLVFGVGDPHARVMLVGEAPGRNEDLNGEPFVGAAGQLLNELLTHAGLERSDVYIANVLKCRPPGNRDPEQTEIETCTPFLREQIRVIDPDVLVTLGNFATKFVLKTDVGITRLHGRVQEAGRFTVLPIYHPAAAIYDRTKRDALFADFATLRELLDAPPAVEANAAAAHESDPVDQPHLF
jgi:uracil-DNA glycosylase